jgi:hypothetical protein
MRTLILILLIVLALPAAARDVYRWVSDDGVIHYSDFDAPGAEMVTIKGTHSDQYSPIVQTKPAESESKQEKAEGYTSFEIVEPEQDVTIRSNEGVVDVGLSLSPALQQGHRLEILIDGALQKGGDELNRTQFRLIGLNRGTHTLEAHVVDAAGKRLISAQQISFHLRKASIIKP